MPWFWPAAWGADWPPSPNSGPNRPCPSAANSASSTSFSPTCANSGLFDVGLLTQYRPLSLIEHVGTGRTWDLDRKLGGLQILQPYLEQESGDWYQGTADAVYRNLAQMPSARWRTW